MGTWFWGACSTAILLAKSRRRSRHIHPTAAAVAGRGGQAGSSSRKYALLQKGSLDLQQRTVIAATADCEVCRVLLQNLQRQGQRAWGADQRSKAKQINEKLAGEIMYVSRYGFASSMVPVRLTQHAEPNRAIPMLSVPHLPNPQPTASLSARQ